jgi:alcohol dehydrogenase (cytochrome c)
MSETVERSTDHPTDVGFSRRKVIAGAGAVTAAAMLGVRLLPGASAQETQVAATPVPLGAAIPPEIADGADDWPTENKDLAQTRYASGSTIDSTNVASLEVAWTYTFDVTSGYGASTANPIVSGDVLYTTDQLSNVYAFNKDTGEQIWRTDYNIPTIGPNGLSIGYGVIAHGLGDSGIAVALDAATGTELWRAPLTNNVGEGIDMAPLIYDNTVYISTVPGNSTVFYRGGQKGIFYALDITSGHTMWQWDTTTGQSVGQCSRELWWRSLAPAGG